METIIICSRNAGYEDHFVNMLKNKKDKKAITVSHQTIVSLIIIFYERGLGRCDRPARQLNNIVIYPEFIIKAEDVEIISNASMFDWRRFYEKGKETVGRHIFVKLKF